MFFHLEYNLHKFILNYWNEEDFQLFEKFIKNNYNKIIDIDFAFSKISDNYFYKLINSISKNLLRFKKIINLNFKV